MTIFANSRMEYDQFIRKEIRKGIDLLSYEILTHQYHDDDIFHYFSESNIFSGGKIIVRSDSSPNTSDDVLKKSRVKLEVKLAVEEALKWEECENHNHGYGYDAVSFPFRTVYYNEPYFLEDRRVYDDLFDLFFGMFFQEREKNSYERLVIRNDVLIILRDVRTWQHLYY